MSRAAVLLALACALAGCGLGPGERNTEVTLTVTTDFGRRGVSPEKDRGATAGDTVMRLLQRSYDVRTRFGGRFVQSVEGIEAGRRRGEQVDWFYYVNGVEADRGAAERRVAEGDRVWWDFHAWGAAMRVPAVVGSFPAPFDSDFEGRRLPITLGCASAVEETCDEVEARLAEEEITRVARTGRTPTVNDASLRIAVGPWSALRRDPTLRALEEGVEASGVYARFEDRGRTLALLTETGEVARRLGPGTGLIAATRFGDQAPIWVVTGTDAIGAKAAAAALAREALANRFAVAVHDGLPLALPIQPAGAP